MCRNSHILRKVDEEDGRKDFYDYWGWTGQLALKKTSEGDLVIFRSREGLHSYREEVE